MPKVRRSRKPPPDGWELIEPTLDELDQKMREGKRTVLSCSFTVSMIEDVVSLCNSFLPLLL